MLAVRDLRTAFRTRDGWLPIVKGISFDIGARQTLAVVGEFGLGQERDRALDHAAARAGDEPDRGLGQARPGASS